MSRTHKDKPNAVQAHQGVWPHPIDDLDVDHVCAEHSNVHDLSWRLRVIYDEDGAVETPLATCNLDDFHYFPSYDAAERNGHYSCRLNPFHWFRKPSQRDIVLFKQKPIRHREKLFTTLAAREYNSGFDDAGEDERILPVSWRGPRTMGGGYWD